MRLRFSQFSRVTFHNPNSLYFQWCNPFFFTTCEDVFHRHWQRYRDSLGGRNGRRASKAEDSQYFSLTLLYAMLAYVAPLSDGMVDPDDSEGHIENCGDTFMARARICLDEELDSPQETTIQALCIMAGREASVGRDARGYAYIGMAMSCALDLGLHADVVPWLEAGRITQEQYRVRIMTWWGLFLYEKWVAVSRDPIFVCSGADSAVIYKDYGLCTWVDPHSAALRLSVCPRRTSFRRLPVMWPADKVNSSTGNSCGSSSGF